MRGRSEAVSPNPVLSNRLAPCDADPASYRFVQHWEGFRIEHPCRHRVEVRLEPGGFVIDAEPRVHRTDLLVRPLDLCRVVAGCLLGVRDPLASPASAEVRRESWAIAAPVYALRDDLLRRFGGPHVQAQRILQDLCGDVPAVARSDAFLRNPFLVRDVVRYRAAAIALVQLDRTATARAAAEPCGPMRETALVEAMANWRGVFSPDGVSYRSLDRTLMNLPAGIRPDLLPRLSAVRLERPMVNAVELTALLLFLDRCGAAVPADRLRLFQHASEAHIGRLVERIGAATRRRLDPLVESDMRFAIDYVSDYPGDCGPTLPALAARAVRWHVRPARRMVEDVLPPGINLTRPTPLPPFPLRKTPGVTFLDTVGAIVAEADSMGHCIASWTARALRGECFLFHVVRHGERASVAVDARGRVLQAAGPRNSANEAMRWGARLLRKWAMAGEAPRPRRRRPALTATQLALPFV